jgi:MSHA biogenesis protein MshE
MTVAESQGVLGFIEYLYQIDVISVETMRLFHSKAWQDDELDQALLREGSFSTNFLQRLKKSYQNTPYVDLTSFAVKREVVHQIPERLARRYQVMLLETDASGYRLAMKNPTDFNALDHLSHYLQAFITPVLVRTHELVRIINLSYLHGEMIHRYSGLLVEEIEKYERKINKDVPTQSEEDVGLDILKAVLLDASRLNASDVHLESDDAGLRIRTRVDGDLQEIALNNRKVANQLFRILKMHAGMDIGTAHVAQDGKLSLQFEGEEINARISITPMERGSSAVIRILDHALEFEDLDAVITSERIRRNVRHFLNKKQGMLLVTGPTGTGKSTTFYTTLREVNKPHKKIITIEDPVELFIPRINQMEVDSAIGFDFPEALRAALRQDPDVVLVGEIRDETTANIAMRAAITGHLVLSTLHTNDTVSTIIRLTNLKVPSYLIAEAVDFIIAQRLLRRNCPHCLLSEKISTQDRDMLSRCIGKSIAPDFMVRHGKGCEYCRGTGYLGRCAVFESLDLDVGLKRLLLAEDLEAFQTVAHQQAEGERLIHDAFELLKQGVTTVDEVLVMAV